MPIRSAKTNKPRSQVKIVLFNEFPLQSSHSLGSQYWCMTLPYSSAWPEDNAIFPLIQSMAVRWSTNLIFIYTCDFKYIEAWSYCKQAFLLNYVLGYLSSCLITARANIRKLLRRTKKSSIFVNYGKSLSFVMHCIDPRKAWEIGT